MSNSMSNLVVLEDKEKNRTNRDLLESLEVNTFVKHWKNRNREKRVEVSANIISAFNRSKQIILIN